jgi:hypothetical protein
VVEEHAGFSLEYAASDQTVAQSLLPMIERGRATAQQFFATTYASTFECSPTVLRSRRAGASRGISQRSRPSAG